MKKLKIKSSILKDKTGYKYICPDCENINRVGISDYLKVGVCEKCGKEVEVIR